MFVSNLSSHESLQPKKQLLYCSVINKKKHMFCY